MFEMTKQMIELAEGIWMDPDGKVYSSERKQTLFGHIAYIDSSRILAAWRSWLVK